MKPSKPARPIGHQKLVDPSWIKSAQQVLEGKSRPTVVQQLALVGVKRSFVKQHIARTLGIGNKRLMAIIMASKFRNEFDPVRAEIRARKMEARKKRATI